MGKDSLKISVKAEDNNAVIRIDGRISDWRNSAPDFKTQLDALITQGVKDASVYINTPGGDCFHANEIGNEISRFTGTITAHLGALCASAGTYIACKCTYVSAARNNNYMIHKPIMVTEGNSDQVKADLKLLENLQSEYAKTYAKKTGLSIQKIESMWAQDYWMNAEEAKLLGFIDEIEGEATVTEQDVQAIKAYKNAPAITASAVNTNDTNNNLDKQMKQLLITALALVATSSDAEVLAHIENLKSKAAKADDLQNKLNELEKTSKDEKAEAVLKAAQEAKKITAAQAPYFKKQLIANFDETKAVLDSMPAMVKLSAETIETGAGSEDRSKWTYADYQEKNPKALEALATNDEETFKRLAEAHYGKKF